MDKLPGEEILEKYFVEKFPDTILDEEAYHLLLLVLEEKPGVFVMSADYRDRELLHCFCDEFDLEMAVKEGGSRSLLDRILRRDTRFIKDSVFITHKEERFDILENSNGEIKGFSDREIGEFLGYPEDAIEFYEEHEIPGRFFEKRIIEFVDNSDLSQEEVELLGLLGYLPAPNMESVEDAVGVAEEREDRLVEFDRKMGLDIGSRYLSKMKDRQKIN